MSDTAKDNTDTSPKADTKAKDQKAKDQKPDAAPESEDAHSLKDLAEQDSAKSKSGAKSGTKSETKSETRSTGSSGQTDASGKGASAAGNGASAKKGGGGLVWALLALIVVGGAVAAGWPYIGPKVQPMVADVRDLMGLGPRPTQVTMPDSEPAAPPPTTREPAAQDPEPAVDPSADTVAETDAGVPDGGAESTPAPGEGPAPMDAAATVTADIEALRTQIDVLKSRIEAMTVTGTGSGENAQAALDATAELNRAIAGLQSDLQALDRRIQALEERPRTDPTAPAQALVLATTQLRARLIGDQPFAPELDALQNIAGDDPAVAEAITRLKPHADVGIPSEATLTARFDKVAKAVINARTTGEAEGWLGRVKDGLGGLVTVRRTNPEAITDEVERAVAIAEAALELGDLAEAVDALGGLQGAPGDAAAAWLGDARARVEAEAALEDLHGRALAALSAAGDN